jgi:AsmA protein
MWCLINRRIIDYLSHFVKHEFGDSRWSENMKKVIKWMEISLGSLVVLIVLTLIAVPFFFNIRKYKPLIEQKVSDVTGRPFKIGGDLKLSLFPLAGITISDLRLGNPDGFEEKDLLTVKSVDIKVRLLPLLSKNVQVKRFVIIGPRIVLEKTKDGKAGWQGLGKKGSAAVTEEEKKTQETSGIPVRSLNMAAFTVREGDLLYIDHTTETRKEIKDLSIELKDVSLEKPLRIAFSANADGKPVSIEGEAGPVGREPGKGTMMVNLSVKAMNTISMKVEGSVTDAAGKPRFDLNISVGSFSPRDLIKGLNPDLALKTRDPEALKTMSARMKLKGAADNIEISECALELDESRITFSAAAKDFSKPDLTFKINLDRLDADRYLPPVEDKKPDQKPESKTATNYAPLRKMILDGSVNIGALTIKGMQIKDLQATLKGRNGIFNLDPVSMNAYEGNVTAVADLDFRGDLPATHAKIEARGIKVRKLVSDLMGKDILDGNAAASINLSMSGDNAALIKKTLDGKGEIQIKDGAVIGIDLSGMINNIKSAFGKAQSGEDKGRTDFSEFIIPFEINDGVVNTQDTSLVSPVLRVKAKGNADLVKESLDFRIEPTFFTSVKGQGDTGERSGYTVPVLVKGTFTDPSYSPDLSGLLQKSLEKGIEKLLDDKTGGDGKSESTKDAVKGLLKGLLGK